MKTLIADKFSNTALDELKEFGGLEVIYDPDLKEASLVQALEKNQPAILVVRSTKVTGDMLKASEALQLVVRAGAGVNTIDVASASKLGVFVTNCPGKNSVAVAELAIGLMVALDRRIPDNVIALRQGKWDKANFSKAQGLKGKTLGLVGFGNIAQEVAIRAKALEMKVVVWSRSLTDDLAASYDITRLKSPVDVAEVSDVVSVHLALTKDTNKICDKKFFDAMRKGAFFINTSRDEIVDEQALLNALNSKSVRAGLDVFVGEPSSGTAEWKSEISSHPNVYGTHHIGASTEQAQEAIGDEALRIIKTFVKRGEVLNCVNMDVEPPASHTMTVRHLNRVGVLAAILGELQKADINVLDMENKIFEGDEAAIAKIRISKDPGKVVDEIRKSHNAIISVAVIKV